MRRYKNSLMGIVAAGVLFSGAAHAGTVSPSLSGSVVVSEGSTTNVTWNLVNPVTGLLNGTLTENNDGTFSYAGVNNDQSVWAFEWDITVDPDPLISAIFAITNNTAGTRHFDFLFTLPVGASFGPPALKSGGLEAAFQDLNSSGSVTLANFDWSGLIDGGSAMTLISGDFSCGGAGCIGNIFPISDGPNPSSGVNASIGIHMMFDLTAGDKVTFNTMFEVAPVPLPAAVWLFGAGLGLLSVFARKKNNQHSL